MVKRQAAAAKSDEPKKKKGKGKPGKRGRKPTRKKSGSDSKHEEVVEHVNGQELKLKKEPEEEKKEAPASPLLDIIKTCDYSDKDILDIEAPTFTTLPKIGCEALEALSWDIKAEMIGGKVSCPMIHCCELCNKPILIYGRMIPCKHVFCMSCAVKDRKNCQHCRADAERVDNVRLGSIFMCTEGGRRYGKDGCRRTYMSPRDLQAHIMHRHTASVNRPKLKPGMVMGTSQSNSAGSTPQNHKAPLSIDVHGSHHGQHPHHPLHNAHALHQRSSMSPRPNNMMAHAGNRRLLSPAGSGVPHHHNIPIQRHPSLQQQHQVQHQQLHHHHLLTSGSALTKGVRPPRISPGLNLPPPTGTPSSADGTPVYSSMTSPSPLPVSSSSLIRPSLGSPAAMARSGTSNLISVPVYDSTGASKPFPPIHRPRMQPPMHVALAAASNFFATTAPPPLPSVTPKVEPASTATPYPQLNLNVPPPNFPLRPTWTQPTTTRPEHSSFFSTT